MTLTTIQIVVWLYSAFTPAALNQAASVLRTAGVEVTWRDCVLPTVCDAHEPHYVLRAAGHSASRSGDVIGDAIIDPATSQGVLATVYEDVIVPLANEANVNPDLFRGYVIAHELGHLLTGTRGHSRTGTMSPGFAHASDLITKSRFDAASVAAMRVRIGDASSR